MCFPKACQESYISKGYSGSLNEIILAYMTETNLLSWTLSRDPKFHMSIYCIFPILNFRYINDIVLLERSQRRCTKAVAGLSEQPYSQRLEKLHLFCLKGTLL